MRFPLYTCLWSIPLLALSLSRLALADGRSQFVVRGIPGGPPNMPQSYAGRITVPNTPPGNGLFFWLFEPNENLTDDSYRDNLFSESPLFFWVIVNYPDHNLLTLQ